MRAKGDCTIPFAAIITGKALAFGVWPGLAGCCDSLVKARKETLVAILILQLSWLPIGSFDTIPCHSTPRS